MMNDVDKDAMMLDTNVAIDYLRGVAEAASFVNRLAHRPLISVVVVGELYAGAREGAERPQLERFLEAMDVIPLSEPMAVAGGLYRRAYGRTHGVDFNDAMIAATAEHENVLLATRNAKHFPMLTNLFTPY